MAHLPPEVLLLIFPLISQLDKWECMTVSRQWHDLIKRHCLFRDITLYFKSKVDDFVDMMERDPILSGKVERLKIDIHLKEEYDAKRLARAFPNLRSFSLLISDFDFGRRQTIDPLQDHPWCNYLEKIVEDTSDLNTRTLLVSGLCKNLTHISTCAIGSLKTTDFVKSLANAPALRTLELLGYSFHYSDFELLHDLVPLLDSIVLKNAVYDISDLPDNVKPATSVKSFKCMNMDFSFIDYYNLHLPYIIQKYTKLEELVLDVDAFGGSDGGDVENDYRLQSITRAKTMLTSHLEKLGSLLKTLSLKVSNYDRSFHDHFNLDILDKCRCQIRHLELGTGLDSRSFEQLAKTNQVQYLQSLTINEMVQAPDGSMSFEWLKNLTKLKELALCFCYRKEEKDRPVLILNDLLENLTEAPLETLRLDNIKLECDESSNCETISSLKNLSFLCASFKERVDIAMTIVFPNLKRLKLDHCLKGKAQFRLPLTDLSYLEITGIYSYDDFDFMVFTRCDNQARLYNTALCTSQPFDPYDEAPDVVFMCNSLYTFIYDE